MGPTACSTADWNEGKLFGFRDKIRLHAYRKRVLEMEYLPNSKLADVRDNCLQMSDIYLFVFWNAYRFHFHLFCMLIFPVFSDIVSLYTISLWQCWGIWMSSQVTRKNSISVFCCCRSCLLTEVTEGQTLFPLCIALAIIAHLASLSLLINSVLSLSPETKKKHRRRSQGPVIAMAKPFSFPVRAENLHELAIKACHWAAAALLFAFLRAGIGSVMAELWVLALLLHVCKENIKGKGKAV